MSVTDRTSAEGLLADAARAAQGARDRIAAAGVDLFLPEATRLSDEQRIGMARLRDGLVTAVEQEMRAHLVAALDGPAPLAAALDAGHVAIALPILTRTALLRDADLVALLLRRIDEHRLVRLLARETVATTDDVALLEQLLDSADPAITAPAMALLIAESRRLDGFGDAALGRTDLPAELQHRLVWWVAAALRDYMTSRHDLDPAEADRLLVAAANMMLAGYDEGETMAARAFALAAALARAGALDDALLARMLREGRLALFVAALALRSGVQADTVWEMIADGDGARAAVLFRAIGCDRAAAAEMLLRLAAFDPRATVPPELRIDAFDQLDPRAARAALLPWRLDEDYLRALAALGQPGRSA